MIKLVLGLFLALCVSSNDVDLFSSMSDMQRLYAKEQDLSAKLTDHLKTVEEQIKVIDNLLGKYYSNYNYTEKDAAEYVSHPINTYVMIKRTALEWPLVQKVLFDEKSEKQMQDLISIMDEFPGEDDLHGAMNGIFLLHETYDLNLTAFSLGQIEIPGQPGKVYQSKFQLNARDLSYLGRLAFNRGFYDRAYEFMMAAEWRAVRDNNTEELPSIKQIIKTIIRGHDETLIKKGPRGRDWKTYAVPFNKELRKKKKFKSVKNKRFSPKPVLYKTLEEHLLWDQFNGLCRGEKFRNPEDEKDLSSYFLHFNDPYLRLGPFKVEALNLAPFVAIYHDFFSDSELETFIATATNKLERSTHFGKEGGTETSVKRTSKQTWLTEDGETSRRETPEQKVFYVANYGIGGVYNHHTDSGDNFMSEPTEFKSEGDRVSTFMGYLSDVQAGGATVFPALGITSWPKRGSAIFWYNLDLNGRLDYWTFHGGCPVLMGSKWITNKWIRWYGQQSSYKCRTDFNEMHRFMPLTNHPVK